VVHYAADEIEVRDRQMSTVSRLSPITSMVVMGFENEDIKGFSGRSKLLEQDEERRWRLRRSSVRGVQGENSIASVLCIPDNDPMFK
jgi:hypothetical protein